jgi:hypothetical protein
MEPNSPSNHQDPHAGRPFAKEKICKITIPSTKTPTQDGRPGWTLEECLGKDEYTKIRNIERNDSK